MVNNYNPVSLEEALKIKKDHPEVSLYTGGSDFMVSKKDAKEVLFLNGIQELKKVTESKEYLEIGAAVVYTDLLKEKELPSVLKEVIPEIASPAIRNFATMGGNICNASPAGDTIAVLYLLDTLVVLAHACEDGTVEERTLPISSFILGIKKTDLHENEILTKILIPKKISSTAKTEVKKMGARNAQAISKALFTALIDVQDGIITDFRVAFGSVGVTAVRSKEIERNYIGLKLVDLKAKVPDMIKEYDGILHPIDDQRSTADYRKKACLNLLQNFLEEAYCGVTRKILIKNGEIIDGTNTDAYQKDIYIENDKIVKIAECGFFDTPVWSFDKIIDAKGLTVTPGFIDTHSHSDLKVLTEPEVLPKLMQGITTEVLGQDGISMAPLPLEYIEPWRKNLAGLDGVSDEIDWTYERTSQYLSMIEKVSPSLNESYLLPHGNIRMAAMGLKDSEASDEEISKMCEITRREMEAGCVGVSSGLIYMPCAYSKTKELIEICKVVREFDGLFVVHQRSEADTILPSMEEILEIGRKSGIRIHFSHFKVCGKNNWKYLEGMLNMLDRAKVEGIPVSLDQYPYIAGSTMLGVILPPWAHDGGTDKLVERLQDEKLREKMKEDIKNGIPGWDNFVNFAGVDGIFITSTSSEKNSNVVGLSLTQLGKMKGKEPLDATFDLLAEEKNAVGMVDFYGKEEHVKKIMQRDEMNVCTDGLLSGTPHPRVYGSFPRVLGKYVREEQVLTLKEAVYKMTGKPASTFRLDKRGVIKEGNYADLVIFDKDKIIDKGTFEDPKQYPDGIIHVLVNGTVEVENQKFTGARNGKVLRKK